MGKQTIPRERRMKQGVEYGIPIVVLLALIFSIASGYCIQIPTLSPRIATIEIPEPFNPYCYVASFKPEAPEISVSSSMSTPLRSLSYITASGTTANSASLPSIALASPSPSPEA